MLAGRGIVMTVLMALACTGVVLLLRTTAAAVPLDVSQNPEPAAPEDDSRTSIGIVDSDAGPLLRILETVDPATDPPAELAPPTPEQRRRHQQKIRDLANDHIAGNALAAMRSLRDPDAAPLLHEALASLDLQQRQLAAHLLRQMTIRPTPRLLEVSVESLHSRVDQELHRTLISRTSPDATRYLYHHRQGTRPALRRALWSGDPQQRWLAAFLLACDGDTDNLAVLVRELITHLQDNDVSGDALMAAHALHHLGPEVAPFLQSWRPSVDEQGRQLIDLILLDLREPPRNRQQLRARRTLHAVTEIYFDPVLEFDIDRSRVSTR
ncbi:MAG: hypothetical protein H6838_07880 [Planctomycetes bacterium]|nr:hypothetical protein [Planctomycetota bacterium]MCB9885396.1 hypothetical protein [Planctomycetota bacterium]